MWFFLLSLIKALDFSSHTFPTPSIVMVNIFVDYLPCGRQWPKNGTFIISFNPNYSPEGVGTDIPLLTFHRCSKSPT